MLVKRKLIASILIIAMLMNLMSISTIFTLAAEVDSGNILSTEVMEDLTVHLNDEKPLLPQTIMVELERLEVQEVPEGEVPTEPIVDPVDIEPLKVALAVDWVLPEGVLFVSDVEGSFTYRAEIAGGNYTLADGVAMPTLTVHVVSPEPDPEGELELVEPLPSLVDDAPLLNAITAGSPVTFETSSGTINGEVQTFISTVYANGSAIIIQDAGDGNSKILLDTNANGIADAGETEYVSFPDGVPTSNNGAYLGNATIFGGTLNADYNGDTRVTMTGGRVKTIFGGSHVDANSIDITMTGDAHVTMTGGLLESIYGGGYLSTWKSDFAFNGNTFVHMTGGTVVSAVFGGGYDDYITSDSDDTGNTNVFIEGGSVGYLEATPAGFYSSYYGAVFGGGDDSYIDGISNVIIGSDRGSPKIASSVFGGGLRGSAGSTNVVVESGNIGTYTDAFPNRTTEAKHASFSKVENDGMAPEVGNVYGGGVYGTVYGTSSVVINGGKIGSDLTDLYVTIFGNVFGGGIMSDSFESKVVINGGTIGGLNVTFADKNDETSELDPALSASVGNVYGGGIIDYAYHASVTLNKGTSIAQSDLSNVTNPMSGNVYAAGIGKGNGGVGRVGEGDIDTQGLFLYPTLTHAAIYFIEGTVAGNLYASGSPMFSPFDEDGIADSDPDKWYSEDQPIVGSSSLLFLNDKADLGGNLYAMEYTLDGDSRPGFYHAMAIVEDTEKLIIESNAKTNDLDAEQHNASMKLAVALVAESITEDSIDNELLSPHIIDVFQVASVLRLQEFEAYGSTGTDVEHWALEGDIDLTDHQIVQDNISFAEGQELYIQESSSLSAPIFAQTAIDNDGYIITYKKDISKVYDDEDGIYTISDPLNRIYRGLFDGGVNVVGGNYYNVGDVAQDLVASHGGDLFDFLGLKIGLDGNYAWSNDMSIAVTPSGTALNTVSPPTTDLGTTTYTATADFVHKFDSVYQGVSQLLQDAGDYRFNIGIVEKTSASDDAVVGVTDDDLVTVTFERTPNANSEDLTVTRIPSGSNAVEPDDFYDTDDDPTDGKIKKPTFWTTSPDNPDTKWEFDNPVEGNLTLYPYYSPYVTVTFMDSDNETVYQEQNVTIGEVAIEPDKRADGFPNEGEGHSVFIAWYTEPDGEGTKFDFYNTPIEENIVLYPYFYEGERSPIFILFEDEVINVDEVFANYEGFDSIDGTLHENFYHTAAIPYYNDLILRPADPTMPNMDFVGWYMAPEAMYDEDGLPIIGEVDETYILFDFSNTIADIGPDPLYFEFVLVLYPVFEERPTTPTRPDRDPPVEEVDRWTVTFEDDNFEDSNYHRQEGVDDGESVSRPSDPSSGDKIFIGWYEDESLTDLYTFSDPVTGDITLYPKFEDEGSVTVTYNKDVDGTDDTAEDKISGLIPGTTITVDNDGGTNPGFDGDVVIDNDTTVPDPTKEDHIFTGYDKTVDPETGKITITATWKPDYETVNVGYNEYTDGTVTTSPEQITGLIPGTEIFIDNAGGDNTGFDGNITIDIDTQVPDPTREGFTFTGYVPSEDANGKITLTATWISDSDLELPPEGGDPEGENPEGGGDNPNGIPETRPTTPDHIITDVPDGATVTPEGLVIDELGVPLGWLPIPEGYSPEEIMFDIDGNPIPLMGIAPPTGDTSLLLNYIALSAISLTGLLFLVFPRYKAKRLGNNQAKSEDKQD